MRNDAITNCDNIPKDRPKTALSYACTEQKERKRIGFKTDNKQEHKTIKNKGNQASAPNFPESFANRSLKSTCFPTFQVQGHLKGQWIPFFQDEKDLKGREYRKGNGISIA